MTPSGSCPDLQVIRSISLDEINIITSFAEIAKTGKSGK